MGNMTPFVRRPDAPVHEASEASSTTSRTVECAPRLDAASEVHLRAVAATTSSAPASAPQPERKTRVLLVDDDPMVLRSIGRVLRQRGYEVTTATNGEDAANVVDTHSFDVVLSDIAMPGMDGIQFLREVREHDLSVPVVLITGAPTVSTAVQALELGAFNYLTKPIAMDDVERVIEKAARMHRMARVTQQAAELLGHTSALGADRAGLEASYERAIQSLWIAYQPILNATSGSVFGYEALLRSGEPTLPHPGAVIDAAERLDRLEELGRTIRDLATSPVAAASDRGVLFVNLHVTDLLDSALYSHDAALSQIAHRVVLEITERSALDQVKDARSRVAQLREMGFRIAVDDLGAGYAGLTSFALLEPEIVKLDMSLVRDVHKNNTKQKIIRSMAGLSKDMGMLVVAEGVETRDERDALIDLGCDLLQGFLFARPGPPFPEVDW
jgi:EAL domain-containing protein (putative c-di-GMP-specific phosphodiesterase class I)